jgi:ribosome-interacting GTPase 1
MSANLTPEYRAAEEAYKEAKDPQEKLICLERMLQTVPKHKGTEKLQSDLKRRISRAREALEKGGGGKKGYGVKVDPEGAAQVVLVGAPNSGKSALVEATTNARVEVADHAFATRAPVPAMLQHENIQFQLVDMPPVSGEYMEYWVPGIMRNAHSALWVIDASDPGFADKIEETTGVLTGRKVRLIGPGAPRGTRQEIVRRLPALVVATKVDEAASAAILPRLQAHLGPEHDLLPLSAMGDADLSELGRRLFALNRIVRVYSKSPGKEPDRSRPFILHEGDDLMDFARQVHKDFAEQLRYARVWGAGKFDGQRVPRDQPLKDGDVIELRL